VVSVPSAVCIIWWKK